MATVVGAVRAVATSGVGKTVLTSAATNAAGRIASGNRRTQMVHSLSRDSLVQDRRSDQVTQREMPGINNALSQGGSLNPPVRPIQRPENRLPPVSFDNDYSELGQIATGKSSPADRSFNPSGGVAALGSMNNSTFAATTAWRNESREAPLTGAPIPKPWSAETANTFMRFDTPTASSQVPRP